MARIAFVLLLLCYCGWVFSLPAFPTQDGPMHLYFVHILSELQHGSSVFQAYFGYRWPPPPYLVHYGLLYLLSAAIPALVAEKVIVCLCVLLFAGGLRSLLLSLAPQSEWLTLIGIPLGLNWTVGMGFHNYCLALGLSLFAAAWWIRSRSAGTSRYRLLFLAAVLVLLFTHPVPLMILLIFASAEYVWSFLTKTPYPNLRADTVTLVLGLSSLLYIVLFVHQGSTVTTLAPAYRHAILIADLIRARPLLLVGGGSAVALYRLFLFALLACCILVGFRNIWIRASKRELQIADLCFLGTFCLLLLFPFIPRSVNGSDFFADRLFLYLWIFGLAGAAHTLSGWVSRQQTVAVAALSLVAISVLGMNDGRVRAAAHDLGQMESQPLQIRGAKGMMVGEPRTFGETHLTFDPYLWSSARFFRRTNTVMMNAPWLNVPILPLAPKAGLFASYLPTPLIDHPLALEQELLHSDSERLKLGKALDFLVAINISPDSKREWGTLTAEDWSRRWDCGKQGWFSFCEAADLSAAPQVSSQASLRGR